MLDFLKRNKVPRPIFEALGVDMHCHLIPGVDDGSKSVNETIELLGIMRACGFKKCVITPHFQHLRFANDEADIQHRYEELKAEVANADLGIELAGIGGEYRVDTAFANRIEQNRFLHVGDESVLVEFSLNQQMYGASQLLYDLQMKDHVVILAHPERYPYLNPLSPQFEKLKDQGVQLQVNLLSLDGFYGEVAMRTAYCLIERGWVEYIGTDLHNPIYGKAMIHASHNRRIEKIINKNKFQNIDLL